MKKVIVLVLIAILMLSLCGCFTTEYVSVVDDQDYVASEVSLDFYNETLVSYDESNAIVIFGNKIEINYVNDGASGYYENWGPIVDTCDRILEGNTTNYSYWKIYINQIVVESGNTYNISNDGIMPISNQEGLSKIEEQNSTILKVEDNFDLIFIRKIDNEYYSITIDANLGDYNVVIGGVDFSVGDKEIIVDGKDNGLGTVYKPDFPLLNNP